MAALTTDRLLLRRPEVVDAADMLVFRGILEVQRFNSTPHTSGAQTVELILEIRRAYEERTSAVWAVTMPATGRVIGLCGFDAWNRHPSGIGGLHLARDL